MSAHGLLAQHIAGLVPKSWRIVGVERTVDEISDVTVIVKLDSIERLPEAPNSGVYKATWTVTVVQPHVDAEDADPAVYDACIELVAALDDGAGWLKWTAAQKVLEAGRYAFDISVETHTKREDA